MYHHFLRSSYPIRFYSPLSKTLPFKLTKNDTNKLFVSNKLFLEDRIKIDPELIINHGDLMKECFIPISRQTTHAMLYTRIVADWYPRNVLEESLLTEELNNLIPLTEESSYSITKKIIYPRTMDISYALEKINARLYDQEMEHIKRDILTTYNTNRVDVSQSDINLHQACITPHSYYAPTFIYQCEINSLLKHKINKYHYWRIL